MTEAVAAAAPAETSRRRLLERAADHVLQHGATDSSLSELARAVGSNNRMLLYYFGSKEEVLREATLVAFERFPHLEGALRRLRDDEGPLRDRLVQVWADIAHPDNRPFLALFFQTFAVALYHPERNTALLDRLGGDWTAAVGQVLEREGLPPADAADVATQLVAEWRGLQLALLSGVPRASLDRAATRLVDRLLLATPR